MTTPHPVTDADRSALGRAVVGLAVAATALLLSTAGDWSAGLLDRPAPLPAEPVSAGAPPSVRALGLVVLAAAPALLAVRGRLRGLVGLLVLLAGPTAVAVAARALLAPEAGDATARPVLALLGGVGTAALGGWIAARGAGWPALGRRYDAPAAARPAPDRGDGVATWDALDRGHDPTAS